MAGTRHGQDDATGLGDQEVPAGRGERRGGVGEISELRRRRGRRGQRDREAGSAVALTFGSTAIAQSTGTSAGVTVAATATARA